MVGKLSISVQSRSTPNGGSGAASQWWRQLPAGPSERVGDRPSSYDAYRFGDGVLEVGGSEPGLLDYVRSLYGDCRLRERGDERVPTVRCTVSPAGHESLARVEFEDPEPLDSFDFMARVHGGSDYYECFRTASGWRCLAQRHDAETPAIALRGSIAWVDRRKPWYPLLAHLGINRLLHFQRQMLFFHAASLRIGGAGALLFGDKGAGKTTTALFLAARGHGLLSDEVGAVRSGDNTLTPYPRALSIRPGPLPERVRARLQAGGFRRERQADGTSRIRARIGSVFQADPPVATPLKCLFFLDGFADKARAQRITPGTEHLKHLQPFGCSLYGASKRSVVFQLATLLSRTRAYSLSLGSPDHTAALIEGITGNA
jgi:hypothetical protein